MIVPLLITVLAATTPAIPAGGGGPLRICSPHDSLNAKVSGTPFS